MEILSEQRLQIRSESDVSIVRSAVRKLAEKLGFDPFAMAAITTATSELTRNVWVHAGGGTALIEEVSSGRRNGIRVQFIDEGPGIANMDRALAGGQSTIGSLGLGLSGSQRLVDEMSIRTEPDQGCHVTITKWQRF